MSHPLKEFIDALKDFADAVAEDELHEDCRSEILHTLVIDPTCKSCAKSAQGFNIITGDDQGERIDRFTDQSQAFDSFRNRIDEIREYQKAKLTTTAGAN